MSWDELTPTEKNNYILHAVKNGVFNIDTIKKAYDEEAVTTPNKFDGSKSSTIRRGSIDNPIQLDEVSISPRTLSLYTYRPVIDNPNYLVGHSSLSIQDLNRGSYYWDDIDRYTDSNGYSFVFDNCSDSTRRVLEQLYGEKLNNYLFTTPGDVRDFLKTKPNVYESTDKSGATKHTIGLTYDQFEEAMKAFHNENLRIYPEDTHTDEQFYELLNRRKTTIGNKFDGSKSSNIHRGADKSWFDRFVEEEARKEAKRRKLARLRGPRRDGSLEPPSPETQRRIAAGMNAVGTLVPSPFSPFLKAPKTYFNIVDSSLSDTMLDATEETHKADKNSKIKKLLDTWDVIDDIGYAISGEHPFPEGF